MSVNPPSSNTARSQGSVLDYINRVDVTKYSGLSQRLAVINQIGMTLSENYVLSQTNQGQQSFLIGNVDAGYDSAKATQAFGGVEALMAGGQGGASGVQIKAAVQNTGEVDKITQETGADLQVAREQASRENLTIHAPSDAPNQPGTTVNAERVGPNNSPEARPNPSMTEKRVISDRKARMEKAKSENNEITNRGTLLQTLSQTGQFFAQGSQANSQIGQMKQQVMNNNYSSTQAVGQSANQTLEAILRNDFYAQNVASSRA